MLPGAFSRLQKRYCTSAKDLFIRHCRLEYKGWIQSDWGSSENNRRAKFYSLTRRGKRELEVELESWERLSTAVGLVLAEVPEAYA